MGAKPFMLAGTFNIVIAQRLGRRICSHCKVQQKVDTDSLAYQHTKECFLDIDKNFLKEEIVRRSIDPVAWAAYMNDGLAFIGSGKDPATGEKCPVCG